MNFDYSPFNPIIWSIFIAVWVFISFIEHAYRKKYRFDNDTLEKDEPVLDELNARH